MLGGPKRVKGPEGPFMDAKFALTPCGDRLRGGEQLITSLSCCLTALLRRCLACVQSTVAEGGPCYRQKFYFASPRSVNFRERNGLDYMLCGNARSTFFARCGDSSNRAVNARVP